MAGVVAELELEVSAALDSINALGSGLDDVIATFSVGLQDALDSLTGASASVEVQADVTQAESDITGLADDAAALDPTINVAADASEATTTVEDTAATIEALNPTMTVGVDDSELVGVQDTLDQIDQSAQQAGQGLTGAGGAADKTQGAFSALEGTATGLGTGLAAMKLNASGAATGMATLGGASTGAAAGIAAAVAAVGLMVREGIEAEAATQRFNQSLGNMASEVEQINVGSLNMDLGELALSLGTDDDALRQAAASFFNLGKAAKLPREEIARTTEQVIALAARAVSLNPALGTVAEVTERMGMALSRGGRFAARFGIDLSAAEINAKALQMTGKATTAELTFYEKAMAGAALATQKYGDELQATVDGGMKNAQIMLASLKARFMEVLETLGRPLVIPLLGVGQALTPILRLVGAVLELNNALNPSLLVMRLFAGVIKVITPLLNTLAGAIEKAARFVTMLGDAFLQLVGSSVGNWLRDIVTMFEMGVREISQLASAIGDVFADVFGGIADFVRSNFGPVVDVIETGVDTIVDVFNFMADNVFPILKTFAGLLADIAFRGPLQTIKDAFGIGGEHAIKWGNDVSTASGKVNDALKVTKQEVDAALGSATSSILGFQSAVSGAFPSISSELSTFMSDWKKQFGDAIPPLFTFIDRLSETQGKINSWMAGVQTLFRLGFTGLGAIVLNAGPELGSAWVQALADAGWDTAAIAALDKTAMAILTSRAQMEATMTILSQAMEAKFLAGDKMPLSATEIMNKVAANIAAGKPALEGVSGGAGKGAEVAFTTAFGVTPTKAGEILTRTVAEATRHTGAMAEAGRALVNGFSNGLAQGIPGAALTGAALVLNVANTILTGASGMTGVGLALGVALAGGLLSSAGIVTAAGTTIATAAGAGTLAAVGVFRTTGFASGAAYGAGIVSAGGVASAAGRALVNVAAAGTRNTGLFATAGSAAARAYAQAVSAAPGAAAAGLHLVTVAAGATRNTGAFAAAGAAAGRAYASALAAQAGAAEAAARAIVRAAERGAQHASPDSRIHFIKIGEDHGLAYAEAFAAQAQAAAAAGQGVTRALVNGLSNSALTAAPTAAGLGRSTTTNSENITIIHVDSMDEALALLPAAARSSASFLNL